MNRICTICNNRTVTREKKKTKRNGQRPILPVDENFPNRDPNRASIIHRPPCLRPGLRRRADKLSPGREVKNTGSEAERKQSRQCGGFRAKPIAASLGKHYLEQSSPPNFPAAPRVRRSPIRKCFPSFCFCPTGPQFPAVFTERKRADPRFDTRRIGSRRCP